MNYADINKRYTATVAEYMAKGYTINTRIGDMAIFTLKP